jgi:hypothetical protein
MTAYSYAVVETALARIFGANAGVQKGAFRGRHQQLWTPGLGADGAGQGRTSGYSARQVPPSLVDLELEEFGINPALAVTMVTGHPALDQAKAAWGNYIPKVLKAGNRSGGDDDVIQVEPYFMSAAWRGDSKFGPATYHDFRATPDRMNGFVGAGRASGSCAFNLSERLRALDASLGSIQEQEGEPS